MDKIKNHYHLSWRQTLALIGLVLLVALSRVAHAPAQTAGQVYEAGSSLQRQ